MNEFSRGTDQYYSTWILQKVYRGFWWFMFILWWRSVYAKGRDTVLVIHLIFGCVMGVGKRAVFLSVTWQKFANFHYWPIIIEKNWHVNCQWVNTNRGSPQYPDLILVRAFLEVGVRVWVYDGIQDNRLIKRSKHYPCQHWFGPRQDYYWTVREVKLHLNLANQSCYPLWSNFCWNVTKFWYL